MVSSTITTRSLGESLATASNTAFANVVFPAPVAPTLRKFHPVTHRSLNDFLAAEASDGFNKIILGTGREVSRIIFLGDDTGFFVIIKSKDPSRAHADGKSITTPVFWASPF
jgi:hypothetical protein